MARNKSLVLLGYDDEPIFEKHKQSLDFKINKIGGKPVSNTFEMIHCSSHLDVYHETPLMFNKQKPNILKTTI